MKVVALRTFVVANPPPHFGGRYFVFCKLTTDDGIDGFGEVYSLPFAPSVVEAMIADVFERHVEGADPFRIERIWRRVYSAGYSQRADPSVSGILSGLEMACWDIVGKSLGQPVYALLGGQLHERLRAYSYLYPEEADRSDVYRDPDLAAERAAQYAAQGFTAVKFDPVGPYTALDPRQLSLETLDRAELLVRRVREAVGGRCDLLIGTHGQMTAASAIRLARRIERYDPLWLEEPVPPENVDEMARVARSTTIPIATGERLVAKHEFRALLTRQAASILQMNLGRVGGLLEARKIAAMAEAHYAQIAPHLYCGPIAGAAAVQLDACSPNFLIQEGIRDWGGFHAQLLERPMRFESGWIIPPAEPGLGIVLDEAVAAAHPYRDRALHLDMHADPAP